MYKKLRVILRGFIVLVALLSAPIGSIDRAWQPPSAADKPELAPTIYDVKVVARYPHDVSAFTQGLLWHDGALFESTGRVGASSIRKVDLVTGQIVASQKIPLGQFGEGLALWNDELISLTWLDGAIHRWSLKDLRRLRSDEGYPYEGWGLTHFEDALVASDGSDKLRFLDPQDYSIKRTVSATLNGRPVSRLNELELVDGLIFANLWMSDFIVGIEPQTGVVRKVIDLRQLEGARSGDRDAVLNGIAWDAEGRRLFVTGKLWPWLYQVRLVERSAGQ
ncbi:glutaminyl-peptide cyclotransferase [Erythrobacter sp. QSSC1-22B]|uniref:glutaminyl-peptide cyclotransferase n=1 Tax=Erythrobacter sp. QSSC1-22B TaxID=1860125 RepID=UPI0009F41F77|nr:glutaminyl-peptide cyclotransferase [Erythrobacter sp. QSSC1-22B]